MRKITMPLIASVLTLTTLLTGCSATILSSSSARESVSTSVQARASEPREVAESYLQYVKEGDFVNAAKLQEVNRDEVVLFESYQDERVAKALVKNLEYTLDDVRITGNRSYVDVTLVLPNMADVTRGAAATAISSALSGNLNPEDAVIDKIVQALEDPATPRMTAKSTMELRQFGDQWLIASTGKTFDLELDFN